MALAQVEKQYGKGAIMRMGEKTTMNIEAIPTGALSLDLALGVGGLPRGRVTEIYGPESSGKSTLAMHVVAEAQRNGGVCAYIDAEHAMDPIYAKAIGVDIDQLLISQPDTGEQALEIADMLVRSGALDVIVIDSVAALTPRAEIEGEMGDSHVGLQARLMSQALRKLTANLNQSKTIMIFINQLREKIGVMFGSPETTPGGRALKFYSSVRLDIRRIESLKDGAEVVGNRTRVKVVKNKVAPPFRQAEFDIMYGKGISREGSLLDMAVDMNIVKKSGAWFTYEGEQLGQGRENAKAFLTGNPEIMVEISDKVLTMAGLRPDEAEAEAAPPSSAPTTTPRSSSTDGVVRHVCSPHDRPRVGRLRREHASVRSRVTAPGLKIISHSSTTRLRWVMPMPAPSIDRARSLVSTSDGRIRNQLTTTRPTQMTREATIQLSDISMRLSDMPTIPIPNTQASTRAGRLRRRCHLATSAPAPARDERRVHEQRSEGGDDAQDVEQAEQLVAVGDVADGEHGGET